MATSQDMLRYIAARDHRLMRRVNRWRAPRWVQWWMVAATRGGDGWLWYLLVLAVLLFGGDERYPAALAAGVAAAFAVLLFLTLKRLAGRTRPCHLEPHCWATLLPPDQFSFPSGHSMTAFAVSVPLGLAYPSLTTALTFVATSVAASRVLLGMHFLSDVVVGSALGVILGYAAYCLAV